MFNKEKTLLKNQLLNNFLFEPTLGQYELIEKLCNFIFCSEQNPVFILKGYAGTGKTSIIGALTKSLPTVKQRTLLLAPTEANLLSTLKKVCLAKPTATSPSVLQVQKSLS